jgi:excinuclease UvrABC ATPase subunit
VSPTDPPRALRIRGARTHNLRNISLDLPRDRLVVRSTITTASWISDIINTKSESTV